jgi:hypothetical protein
MENLRVIQEKSIIDILDLIPDKKIINLGLFLHQKNIIDLGYKKISHHLQIASEQNKLLTFFLTIPVWDKEGQKIINYNNKIDYGEFEVIDLIKKSPFFRGLRIISKEEFTYIDHNFKLLKNKTIQNTYFILLSSSNISFDKVNTYNFYE